MSLPPASLEICYFAISKTHNCDESERGFAVNIAEQTSIGHNEGRFIAGNNSFCWNLSEGDAAKLSKVIDRKRSSKLGLVRGNIPGKQDWGKMAVNSIGSLESLVPEWIEMVSWIMPQVQDMF